MGRKIVVAAIQLGPVSVERETAERDRKNVGSRIRQLMEEAGKVKAGIVCMPELSLTHFFPNTLIRDNDYLFDELPSPLIEPLIEVAKRYEMVMLLPYAEADGFCHYNSCMVFDYDGTVLGKYRKVHIPAYFPSDLPGGTGRTPLPSWPPAWRSRRARCAGPASRESPWFPRQRPFLH